MLQCAKGKDRSEIAALSIILERVFFESGSGEHGVDNGPDMEIAGIEYKMTISEEIGFLV